MNSNEDPRSLWQAQPSNEKLVMSTHDLVTKEAKLTRTVRRRNVREYVAGASVFAVFAAYTLALPGGSLGTSLMRAGSAFIALGALVVLAKLRRDGSALPSPPASAPTSDHLAHHRAALTRQRDLLRGVPAWYVGPFLPGLFVFTVGSWLMARNVVATAVSTSVCAGVLGMIIALNRRGARRLQSEIDALG